MRLRRWNGWELPCLRPMRVLFAASAFSVPDCRQKPSFPSGSSGLSVRRTTLHRIMTEQAAALGADLLWRSTVTGISNQYVHLGERSIRTRWIVGADGANSRVRRWAGLDAHSRTGLRYAFRRHYRVAPWTDRMEIYWGKHAQGYATAVSSDQVCVAVASHDPALRLEESLLAFPELNARLRGAETLSAEMGSVTANRKLKRVCRGNVALIGDASGTVDAITGEGLGLSFSQAVVLAGLFPVRKSQRLSSRTSPPGIASAAGWRD